MDDAEGGSKHVPDAMSAEYSVGAIHATMLRAVLQGGEPARKSIQSERACSEIQRRFGFANAVASDVLGVSDSQLLTTTTVFEAGCHCHP